MEELIGEVTHYFGKISVAAVKLKKQIKIGDTLHFKGATTDFKDTVTSMQIRQEKVNVAKKGDEVGIKVKDKVREGDKVYKILE
jgi:translation initiation factor IF-2